jgi:hypothetical protein
VSIHPEEIWAGIRFDKIKKPEIVSNILENSVLTTEAGIKAAIANAAWQGFCAGRASFGDGLSNEEPM